MKKIFTLCCSLFVLFVCDNHAQKMILDSANLQTFYVKENLMKREMVIPDTLPFNFQINNPIFWESIGNTYDGNLGSPYLSQLYFKRNYSTDFIFLQPYNAYLNFPSNHYFYNTKTPYTNFAYNSGGSNEFKEEFFKLLFTRNIGPHWNIEGNIQQFFGRGAYANQSTSHLSYDFSLNYISPTYNLYFTGIKNSLKNKENGGLINDNYVTNPELTADKFTNPQQFPTRLSSAQNNIYNRFIFLGQSYNLNVKSKNDSFPNLKIPFATISHSFSMEYNQKTFNDGIGDSSFYQDLGLTPLLGEKTSDNTNFYSAKNKLAIDFNEEVNRWAKFGMGAYLQYEQREYEFEQFFSDSLGLQLHKENYTIFGGEIYKTKGKNLTYNASLNLHLQGSKAGDLTVNGSSQLKFDALKRTLGIKVLGEFSSKTPDYLQQNYMSNYFQWFNYFDKIYRSRFSAEINSLPNKSRLYASVENITDYIYWGNNVKPLQYGGNIQIIETGAEINLKISNTLHLDNHIVFQQSSNANIVSLPKFTSYSNFYYSDVVAKVLLVQLGIEAYYFSSYNAPNYMPALGIYYNQDEVQLGAFPVITPYFNFHLKRIRFYIKWYHINDTLTTPKYFTSPHYPLNPSRLEFGFSWNFYT